MIFNNEVENSSCTKPTRVHRSWSRVHELNGTQH